MLQWSTELYFGNLLFCNVAMLNDRDHATVIILTGIFDFDEYVEFWDVLYIKWTVFSKFYEERGKFCHVGSGAMFCTLIHH